MDEILIDNLVIFFGLIFYAFLSIIYLIRAHEKTKLEIKLGPAFSTLLIPFITLWVANFFTQNNFGRLLAGLPIILYLSYDLWYRQITKKKHPIIQNVGLLA